MIFSSNKWMLHIIRKDQLDHAYSDTPVVRSFFPTAKTIHNASTCSEIFIFKKIIKRGEGEKKQEKKLYYKSTCSKSEAVDLRFGSLQQNCEKFRIPKYLQGI